MLLERRRSEMPLYDFQCEDCDEIFEVRASIREKAARLKPECPKCHRLFDPACPPLPPGAQLPLVFVNGEVLSNGGKISAPAIRRRLEALGLHPDGH